MSTPARRYRRRTRVIAGLAALLAAAGIVVGMGIGGRSAETARRAAGPFTAVTVTQAVVTGYAAGSLESGSSDPVSVTLRGAPATRLFRVAEGLPAGNGQLCAENMQSYRVTFASADGPVVVTADMCGGGVYLRARGRTGDRTDDECTLLYAVRRVLPATALVTQHDGSCD